jgi:hypothetical protein
VRITRRVLGTQANLGKKLSDPCICRRAFGKPMNRQSFTDDRADRHPRVQARERVLEDDLHLAPEPTELSSFEREDVGAVERHRASRWLDESEDRPS